MKTYQLVVRIHNSQVTAFIHALNEAQAKIIARSYGWQILTITELKA